MTHVLSYSQFGELLGIDPKKIAAVVWEPSSRTVVIEEAEMAQTSGSYPQLGKGGGGKKSGGKKGKGC